MRITLAYSPDTDDAFMVEAMRLGKVDLKGYEFEYVSADIQVLNEAALSGEYDVTAISVAAYPSLADDYLLMPVGASVGDRFGPAVVVREDSPLSSLAELAKKRIAVPGKMTTAYLAASELIGDFTALPMLFLDIAPAVISGEADAGLLIHERQLDCEKHGLKKITDLGSAWHERHALPLPLGANAIRRALGEKVIIEVNAIYRASIEAGLADRDATLASALKASKAGLDPALGHRYIDMYVNDRSLAFAADAREAMRRLYAASAARGLTRPIDLASAFVPETP